MAKQLYRAKSNMNERNSKSINTTLKYQMNWAGITMPL